MFCQKLTNRQGSFVKKYIMGCLAGLGVILNAIALITVCALLSGMGWWFVVMIVVVAVIALVLMNRYDSSGTGKKKINSASTTSYGESYEAPDEDNCVEALEEPLNEYLDEPLDKPLDEPVDYVDETPVVEEHVYKPVTMDDLIERLKAEAPKIEAYYEEKRRVGFNINEYIEVKERILEAIRTREVTIRELDEFEMQIGNYYGFLDSLDEEIDEILEEIEDLRW